MLFEQRFLFVNRVSLENCASFKIKMSKALSREVPQQVGSVVLKFIETNKHLNKQAKHIYGSE